MLKKLLKQNALLSYFVRMLRIYNLKRSKPKMSLSGFPFIGYDNMISGEFEKMEFKYIKNEVADVDLFVNVGANIGYYVAAGLHFNKAVMAFEPDINNFTLLQKNVSISAHPDKCLFFNMGVGSNWDRLKIFHAATGSSFIKGWANNSSLFYNEVSIVRLDDFHWEGYKKLLFLVDVEGFESEVIFGAKRIISSDISQTWIIEIMTTDEYILDNSLSIKQLELLKIFKDNKFNLFFLSETGDSEISFEDLEDSIRMRKATYGHNFIFKKY